MFADTPQDVPPGLNQAIDAVFVQMTNHRSDSEEYARMADQLLKLYSVKEQPSPNRVSPDVLATIIGNLAGIILIVGYERANVVTSKALSFVLKLR